VCVPCAVTAYVGVGACETGRNRDRNSACACVYGGCILHSAT